MTIRINVFGKNTFPAVLLFCGISSLLTGCSGSSTAPGTTGLATHRKVEIRKENGSYRFYRDGLPFYIKGAAGRVNLDLLRKAGGNTIRTYTTDGLDTLLDQAHALGLAVMAGIWVGRGKEGFSYDDEEAVRLQKEQVRAIVERYKDHPALLCWAVGNEPEIKAEKTKALWSSLNDLIVMIHEIDPDHPVTIPVISVPEVARNCPDIDFLSVNFFGQLKDFSKTYKGDIPFVYSEWGPLGPWECRKTYWGAPLEESLPMKWKTIDYAYRKHILPGSGRCLGSFIFYWGYKQETTHTWFSMFMKNGEKTTLVDLMSVLWEGESAANWAPILDELLLDGKDTSTDRELRAGQIASASVRGTDPEQDSLRYQWEIVPDEPAYEAVPGKGWVEIHPGALPGLIREVRGPELVFQVPLHTGAYRLFVYAFDGHGNGAYANMPFFVVDRRLTDD